MGRTKRELNVESISKKFGADYTQACDNRNVGCKVVVGEYSVSDRCRCVLYVGRDQTLVQKFAIA